MTELKDKSAHKSGQQEEEARQQRAAAAASWDALEALTREMREGGWDGYDYKEFRRRWGRRFFDAWYSSG